MKYRYKIPLLIVGILIILYLSGPKFKTPVLTKTLPKIEIGSSSIDDFIKENERKFKIKPDNESRIIWANDTLKNKTEYVLLYLHGYSASWYEGYPTNVNFAKKFTVNAYFPRLVSHGIDTTEALIDMTPENLYESAKEALIIAHQLGNKVIIMSTSTGGTLALKLASEYPEMVNSLILFSPNIRINNPSAFLLSGHWGLQLARLSAGGSKYRVVKSDSPEEDKYWQNKYRWEATIYLQQLIEATMNKKTFANVKQPVFLGYYYKNEEEQDKVVKVSALLKMYDQLGTPIENKYKIAFAEAGGHVIGCELFSKCVEDVQNEVFKFAEKSIFNSSK